MNRKIPIRPKKRLYGDFLYSRKLLSDWLVESGIAAFLFSQKFNLLFQLVEKFHQLVRKLDQLKSCSHCFLFYTSEKMPIGGVLSMIWCIFSGKG